MQAAAESPTNSAEKFLVSNSLKLCYQTFGENQNPAIVLIMGLGTQMIGWPDEFCQILAHEGYYVIRFDNRDIGLSEKIEVSRPTPLAKVLLRARLGLKTKVDYTLHDMARDTVGILDALNISKAHFVGASMGGMIAQIVAAEHSKRCLSMTSIMSTTGNSSLPTADWRVTLQMLKRPSSKSESALLEHGLKLWAVIGSPDFPPSKQELEQRILRSLRRSIYPQGYLNQAAAIIHNGDRRKLLSTISCPSLVIHGKADVLVPVEGGIDTARNISGAKLKILEGMGHDLPKELYPRIARMIANHASNS